MMAAHAVDCHALFELCAAALASEFKKAEWNRTMIEFGLEDFQFSWEESERLQAQYPWIMGPAEIKVQ